jgi:uncharacterized protein (TIGR04255 family)
MILPKKLGKEPLVEALFEMRFKAKAPVSSILPGLVFAKFSGAKTVEKLASAGLAELPEPILANMDSNFRYVPVVRIHWANFMILSGNQSAGLACKLPYPGWTAGFKPAIIKLAELINEAGIVDTVERFSLKYTNVISFDFGTPRSIVNFELRIGRHDAATHLFQIRAELPKDNFVSIVQIVADALTTFHDGSTRKGIAIDIDTVSMAKDAAFPDFFSGLSDQLDGAHAEAKEIFFGCLMPDALAKLEPVYD